VSQPACHTARKPADRLAVKKKIKTEHRFKKIEYTDDADIHSVSLKIVCGRLTGKQVES